MTSHNHIADLSESFLHFLDDDNYDRNNPTFCQEQSNLYHDSSYIWCKVCNKIFCTRCSLNHLINNQVGHCPSDKVFLRKEHFDVEFSRDKEKIIEIRRSMDEFLNKNNNKDISKLEINSLYDTLSKFSELAKELSNFIDNFTNKIKIALNTIQNKAKNIISNGLNEDKLYNRYNEICSEFKNIEKKYYLNQQFSPSQLKEYHDSLASGYEDCQKFHDLIQSNKTRIIFSSEIGEEFNKIKNIMTNALDTINSCKNYFEKLIKDKSI